ncbi:MAG: hypothetical protein KDB37_07060 [Ilumatobacter sp.]|nr:hypothetical protein [Ilumatobacter sp.]
MIGDADAAREVVDTEGQTRTDVPSDNTTLTAVLDELEADGYTGSFVVRPDASLMCTTCRETTPASRFEPTLTRRLEGASDPSDELWVVAAACPNCGAHGTVVLGFGPEASEDDALVVAELDVEPAG